MKLVLLLPFALLLAGCTPSQRNPDEIRHEAAKATTEVAHDAKAVVQGVSDGLKNHASVNINSAPAADIEKLPGIDAPIARRIVAGRPYASSDELVKRHLVSKSEYDRIASQIVAE
jgi:DNA uptake protein ComE-like DNA-binding protein